MKTVPPFVSGFDIAAWVTPLIVAMPFAVDSYLIASREAPQAASIGFPLFLGLVIQVGLLATPWALTRGTLARLAIGLLMLPAFLALMRLAFGPTIFLFHFGIADFARIAFLWGVFVHAWAYVVLIRRYVPS
jgi:hypothetical protein